MATFIVRRSWQVQLCSLYKLLESRIGTSVNCTSVCYKSQHIKERKKLKPAEDTKKTKTFKKTTKKAEIRTVDDTIQKDNFYGDVPEGNVYFIKDYPPQLQSLQSALKCHREYAQPSMFNNMSGKVFIHFDLDMSAKKQTKSKPNFNDFLHFPHKFETGKNIRCVVICPNERKQEAQGLGAVHAGGEDLIDMLHPRKGTIHSSAYDIILCTPDMIPAMTNQRATFRKTMPSEDKGSVSNDIKEMIKLFKNTVLYSSTKEGKKGTMQIPIGTLDMSDEQLQENFAFLIETVTSKYKNAPLIDALKVLVPPSPEEFLLDRVLCIPDFKPVTDEKDLKQEESKDVDEDSDDEDDKDFVTKKALKKQEDDDDDDEDDDVDGDSKETGTAV